MTQGFCTENSPLQATDNFETITTDQLKAISALDGPTDAIAIFQKQTLSIASDRPAQTVLVLDRVQDPGNAGALIRLADWFGVTYIAWPTGTVEPWNPKVVQASMGALARMPIVQQSAEAFISEFQSEGRQIVVADLGGQPPQEFTKGQPIALVMGNEGQGPDPLWSDAAHHVITIPRAQGRQTESLNVATAAAILLYETSTASR